MTQWLCPSVAECGISRHKRLQSESPKDNILAVFLSSWVHTTHTTGIVRTLLIVLAGEVLAAFLITQV